MTHYTIVPGLKPVAIALDSVFLKVVAFQV